MAGQKLWRRRECSLALGSSFITVHAIARTCARAREHIDPHRLIAAPDCGLGLLGRNLASRKLEVLVEAAGSL
jgi:5-methyltetrahydropteroyltriglutamate--homocysteine methyltransferase